MIVSHHFIIFKSGIIFDITLNEIFRTRSRFFRAGLSTILYLAVIILSSRRLYITAVALKPSQRVRLTLLPFFDRF